MYVHTHAYIYTYIYMYIYIYIFSHSYAYACIYTFTYVYTHIYMSVRACISMCLSTWEVCIYNFMYVAIYIYTYMNTNMTNMHIYIHFYGHTYRHRCIYVITYTYYCILGPTLEPSWTPLLQPAQSLGLFCWGLFKAGTCDGAGLLLAATVWAVGDEPQAGSIHINRPTKKSRTERYTYTQICTCLQVDVSRCKGIFLVFLYRYKWLYVYPSKRLHMYICTHVAAENIYVQ